MTNIFRDDAVGKLIIRLTLGGLMLFHGVAKVLNPESLGSITSMLEGVGLPGDLAYGIYIGEVLAPLMVVLGIYCRLGGFIIAVNMLFALGLAHTDDFFSLTGFGGWAIELQVFYLFSGLALVFLGGGRYAIRPD